MRIKVNALSQAKLIRLLLEGTRTYRELAEETGLHYVTVREYISYLRREGIVHIAEYQADERGRYIRKVFKLGKGRDVPRMNPLTNAERQARARQNKKARALHAVMTFQGANHEQPAAGFSDAGHADHLTVDCTPA